MRLRSAVLLAALVTIGPGTARAAAPSVVPAESRQMVLSLSSGWGATTARVRWFERAAAGAPWRPVGEPVTASLGRGGMAWGTGLHPPELAGPAKREGDGRSPAGVFDLRLVTGYAAEPPAGTRLLYRPATPTLRCVDDPRSTSYNRLVEEGQVAKDWTSAEDMRRADTLYRLTVWVGHNDTPPLAGMGSCIFLHQRESADSVTAGCTAFDAAPLDRLVGWLDPAKRPVLVQLPDGAYHAFSAAWGLPAR